MKIFKVNKMNLEEEMKEAQIKNYKQITYECNIPTDKVYVNDAIKIAKRHTEKEINEIAKKIVALQFWSADQDEYLKEVERYLKSKGYNIKLK